MKKILLFVFVICTFSIAKAQTIAQARAQGAGATVTLTGVAINGSTLGTIRYLQDATAGIAVYGAALNSTQIGDEISVTGTLVDYNGLLEMNPITNFSINSSANLIPAPVVLTPNILSDTYEGELIEIDNATFANGGSVFAVNTNYTYTSNGLTGQVRITGSLNPLVGTTIPTGAVNIVGILSQYTTTYQLLPRGLGDITNLGSIFMISNPTQSNTTTNGMDVNWTTNISGSASFIKYGRTPSFELGSIAGTSGSVNHSATITGANPADIFYVQAYSINGTDTAFSPVKLFATVSASTGNIKVYFNKSTEPAVALPGNNAATLAGSIDDTLIAYINRAKYTIDIAVYNFDNTNISNITAALNNAYTNRSVRVRVISDGSSTNLGLATLVSGIDQVASPTSINFGIMHNKFMIIDAASANPNDAILWTGSTNWTDNQINSDANNVVIFQDQSIALGYQMEFEEMWGSTTATHSANGKFGYQKQDNTPHEYTIGGKKVEQYFSPSDGVNAKILNTMNTADYDLYFAVFNLTRNDLAWGVRDRITTGVYAAGMVNDTGSTSYPFNIMAPVMGSDLKIYTQPGILHHKYLIVDQDHSSSDPLVLTGSHNWSNSADTKNDENTVIIHDQNIANQYYQEFVKRFNGQTGGTVLAIQNNATPLTQVITYPNPTKGIFNIAIQLTRKAKVTIAIADLQGRNIASNQEELQAGSNLKMLDLSFLQKGVYIVTVSTENYSSNVKMVVE
jgi:phosphatidylserine/phosphatidylglycerophosphate/cardiolipin synthase-like enzyme